MIAKFLRYPFLSLSPFSIARDYIKFKGIERLIVKVKGKRSSHACSFTLLKCFRFLGYEIKLHLRKRHLHENVLNVERKEA